ncbi:hypothetical protein VE04_01403 [Pseudogymnoascus sp. 24MN13]|nr:hypothetical protein VE04_01403 [Pseudogymnoascus sp. 24MN13]
MVKFYDTDFTYDYSFPAVALAYFLRYPNPYSTHVLSSDRSRLPPAILKLLPKSVQGNVAGGSSSSYILETSTVDAKEGWMQTESRNLDWTGILSVVEKQVYTRQTSGEKVALDDMQAEARRAEADEVNANLDEEPKKGFLASWSTAGIQRSIEAIASRRTIDSQGKSKMGMTIVLERLRNGGLMGGLEGMRRDREALFSGDAAVKRAWKDEKHQVEKEE